MDEHFEIFFIQIRGTDWVEKISKLKLVDWETGWSKTSKTKSNSFFPFFPYEVDRSKKKKKRKIELLQSTKNQKVDFYICLKYP